VVPDSSCSTPKPPTTQACNQNVCPISCTGSSCVCNQTCAPGAGGTLNSDCLSCSCPQFRTSAWCQNSYIIITLAFALLPQNQDSFIGDFRNDIASVLKISTSQIQITLIQLNNTNNEATVTFWLLSSPNPPLTVAQQLAQLVGFSSTLQLQLAQFSNGSSTNSSCPISCVQTPALSTGAVTRGLDPTFYIVTGLTGPSSSTGVGSSSSSSSKSQALGLGIGLGLGVPLIGISAIAFIYYKRTKEQPTTEMTKRV